ncbi:LysR family transcriptional regulator [Castellaniella caeni]|uniref:LysR family transcriptional regulator n=1 Tax=Castellaniella caeni TaxID=266123 RepID=UPI0008295B5E|nr:LysR family transcriptional regulator [Castellaniella caeni]
MIQFSIRQLEYFVAVAKHGGTLQAARALNVSQPSISHAICMLEANWGVSLFVRQHARGLQLTAEGELRFRQALRLLREADSLAQRGEKDVRGVLVVGCFDTLGPLVFPALMKAFQRRYPDVQLRPHEGHIADLLSQVADGTMELALVYDTSLADGRIRLHDIGASLPYAVLPVGHPLALQADVSVVDMARYPFILINPPHSREYFLSLFSHAGARPHVVAEVGSFEMVRALVANGHGVSILVTRPAGDLAYDGSPLVCRPLRDTPPPQRIVLASAADLPLSAIAQAFLDLARDYLAGQGMCGG